jgi:hypothetical protein
LLKLVAVAKITDSVIEMLKQVVGNLVTVVEITNSVFAHLVTVVNNLVTVVENLVTVDNCDFPEASGRGPGAQTW